MECKHLLRRVSFERELRVVVEVAPAVVTVEAIAVVADTEKIVAPVGIALPEMMMLVVEFDTVDQKANTDSEEAGPRLVDWVKGSASCNNEVVEWLGSHLGLAFDRRTPLPQADAGEQPDEVMQELTLGSVYRMHYRFFWDPWKKEKISPQLTVDGLRKMILSEQVEASLILSESQLALACLSKFGQTCVLPEGVYQEILVLNLPPRGHYLNQIALLQLICQDCNNIFPTVTTLN